MCVCARLVAWLFAQLVTSKGPSESIGSFACSKILFCIQVCLMSARDLTLHERLQRLCLCVRPYSNAQLCCCVAMQYTVRAMLRVKLLLKVLYALAV